MHPAAAKALFDEDAAHLSAPLAARRRWIFHTVEYPVIDVSFTAPGRTTLRLRLNCDNWNDSPPAITLLSRDGEPLTTAPNDPTGVFNGSLHPLENRQFICMRGSREYHTHPSHVGDPWESLRGGDNYKLGGILTQIWNAWLKGTG